MVELQYPEGPFTVVTDPGAEEFGGWISDIENLPRLMREAVQSLPQGGLDRHYRPGGWTGRQVVHHVADSHMNAYCRFRLALTEDNPIIKPYAEEKWAELYDACNSPVEISLDLLTAVHHRWALLMGHLAPEQWSRTFIHPVTGTHDLATALQMYSWHGRNHLGHLRLLR
ncbi:MAG: putative metal-dependent hydrolase [Acidobacteria bacterium]|nr:putative metal-dependent hydrolase [Acidobacteriota bacterium]